MLFKLLNDNWFIDHISGKRTKQSIANINHYYILTTPNIYFSETFNLYNIYSLTSNIAALLNND